MTEYLLLLPISMLVAYSQIIVKWRSGYINASVDHWGIRQVANYLFDPVIFSAYLAAFVASLAWLYIVTKLPLTVAFPVYIGVTFILVLLGGWLLLSEAMTISRLISMVLILAGIVVGLTASAE